MLDERFHRSQGDVFELLSRPNTEAWSSSQMLSEKAGSLKLEQLIIFIDRAFIDSIIKWSPQC